MTDLAYAVLALAFVFLAGGLTFAVAVGAALCVRRWWGELRRPCPARVRVGEGGRRPSRIYDGPEDQP